MIILGLVWAFLIAYFLGSKRQIGFYWSLFFSIFLSPIGGLIVTMLSRKYYSPTPAPSKPQKIIGYVLICLSCLLVPSSLFLLKKVPEQYLQNHVSGMIAWIGIGGLGFYLIQLSKGISFNNKELIKEDEKQ